MRCTMTRRTSLPASDQHQASFKTDFTTGNRTALKIKNKTIFIRNQRHSKISTIKTRKIKILKWFIKMLKFLIRHSRRAERLEAGSGPVAPALIWISPGTPFGDVSRKGSELPNMEIFRTWLFLSLFLSLVFIKSRCKLKYLYLFF